MTKIIILLILFNVATAYFKNRAKKKREAEARVGANPGTVSTATSEVISEKREAPAWASRHEEDGSERDWDEAHQTEDNSEESWEEESENPYREAPERMKIPAAKPEIQRDSGRGSKDLSGLGGDRSESRVPKTPSKAKEAGKDFLSQLAKELGLELPERPKPKPVPRPAVPVPAEAVRTAYASRSNRILSEDDDHARTVADSTPGADLTSAPGIAAMESANAAAYAIRDGSQVTALSTLRADLLAPESLRRAFILKTVLDKPLSLQPHSPGLPNAK